MKLADLNLQTTKIISSKNIPLTEFLNIAKSYGCDMSDERYWIEAYREWIK